jgi:glycosyltransferase involved in cell wall biosynthesis
MSIRPKRVLHVVRAMNRGGVETWLMNVLRHLDRRRVEMDFLVHTSQPAAYDGELLAGGSRLLRCCDAVWRPTYAFRIGRLLREYGPYDVIHSHVHHFSGYLMALARRFGVPSRISHSHSDTSSRDAMAGWLRQGYLAGSEALIRADATKLIAASEPAARALFGKRWRNDPRSLVLHCGIDLAPFLEISERNAIRRSWGVEDSDLLIGHVGRFDEPKNHRFLVEILAAALRREPRTRLLLVGEGPLRNQVEEQACRAGIRQRTIFAGVRGDVPRLLKVMDVFVFPSHWEGLGLTLVEAQAACLPCVISESIPEEADVVPGLIHRLPLCRPASDWAEATLEAPKRRNSKTEALAAVEQSSFNIANSMEQLYALYGA